MTTMQDDLKVFERFEKLEEADREWQRLHAIEQNIAKLGPEESEQRSYLEFRAKTASKRVVEALHIMKEHLDEET